MEAWREDQLNLLVASGGQDEVFSKVTGLARGLGFTNCAYGMRAPLPLSRPEIVMLNDYSDAWRSRYEDAAYLSVDPTVQRGAASLEAFAWSHRQSGSAAVAEFWEDAVGHGVSYGVSLPMLAANSVRGMLTLTRGNDFPTEKELAGKWPQLLWLGQVAHHALSRQILHRWRSSIGDGLSDRETEILRWVAEGKTNKQIASRINVTERTVNFHLNNAMAKLGVPNRTAAAVSALILGIIA